MSQKKTSLTMHTIHDILHATDAVSRRISEADASPDAAPELSPKERADSIIAKNRSKPYLKNYSATLNTVPVVGLKGDNVMYTQTKTGGLRGVEDVWSIFGKLPDGVNINSSKGVHFFPYKGDFCMSVGTTVWRKKHRSREDPVIKSAVDNWPQLYLDAWEKVGDGCLPVPNARNVIPFARLAGKDIRFHLVVLTDDGRLLSLDGDLAHSGNTFSELRNESDGKDQAAKTLKVEKAAYWNGNIVAYDKTKTWNLDVDFDSHTFKAADGTVVDELFELTATDIGPVGVKKDGWLYRRYLENVADPDSNDKGEKKIGWKRWIQQSGVTNLGVASPGVMLDMETLTRSLRDRYLNTQTSIYPVVNKIQSFAIHHELFLKKQLQAAKEWAAIPESNAAKRKLAISEAKKLVRQTQVWASIMRKQSNHTKVSVNLLAEQFTSVKTELLQQQQMLHDRLLQLKSQIEDLKKAKSKMDAAFWGSIGVMLLGIGLAIIGAVTGVGVVALGIVGGALFVGGLVAACYFGTQSSKIAGEIAAKQSEMDGVQLALNETKALADRYGDLSNMFDTLNQFWGRMFNAAGNLKDMDDSTAEFLGMKTMEDTISIEAGLDIVKEIKGGCATYLAVLNRSGIKIPNDDSDSDDDDEAADAELSGVLSDVHIQTDITFKTVSIFNTQVARATAALERGDFAESEKHLEAADLIDVCTLHMGIPPDAVAKAIEGAEDVEAAGVVNSLVSFAMPSNDTARSLEAKTAVVKGASHDGEEAADIFDFMPVVAIGRGIIGLFGASDMATSSAENEQAADLDFGSVGRAFLDPGALLSSLGLLRHSVPFSSAMPNGGILNGLLVESRAKVLGMVNKTVEMTGIAEEWLNKIPDVPASEEDISVFTRMRKEALSSCKLALQSSADANNSFVAFNHQARDEEARVQQEIRAILDRLHTMEAEFRSRVEQERRLQVRDFLSFGLSRAAVELKISELGRRYSDEAASLQMEIAMRQQHLTVGQQYMGSSETWLQLCQRVSGDLGGIYNTLTAVKDGIKIDARLYKELAATHWNEIRRAADAVKQALQPIASHDLDQGSSVMIQASASLALVASPAPSLLGELKTQTDGSKTVWDNIGKLATLTYTDDMVAYFDQSSTTKVPLSEIIRNIKRTYVQTASLHYQTIEQISSLALAQRYRADALATRKISTHIFLKGTFLTISMTHEKAKAMRKVIAELSPGLEYKIKVIKSSIGELRQAIETANLDLARRDKAYRDKVTGLLVEGCLKGFATGALVAAAAFAAYSGAPIATIPALLTAAGVTLGTGEDESSKEDHAANGEDVHIAVPNGTLKEPHNVNGVSEGLAADADAEPEPPKDGDDKDKTVPPKQRIEAAKDTWDAISKILRSAKDAAAATSLGRALFNKLSLAELLTLMQLVQAAVVVMERTVTAVERLTSPLEDLFKSVTGVVDILSEMDERCRKFNVDVDDDSTAGGFGSKEAEEVKKSWADVRDACVMWLDVLNAQGISPILFAVVERDAMLEA
ncbi:hypothetical protein B0T14DRAFT_478794 [Immersiella caudata]|uniref:Uncharacterized protein n=1 Tax=Immersiella caudata TaxID=314043 RepID=A0AA40BYY9_9PEZI|nr:hypothetical protein B0T14DRAFT_478794 [Immersiella caudata]